MASDTRHEGLKAAKGRLGVSSLAGKAHSSLRESIEQAPPHLRRGAARILIGALVLLIGIIGWKYYSFKVEEAARAREIAAGPVVRVARVVPSPGDHQVNVIGETRPYQTATLYAKVSGYLKEIRVDKGDIVKKGQILGIIESPETDQAYEAALADARNKVAIYKRVTTLKAKGLVSQQEADQAQTDADVATARLHSTETEKSYETIRAPFKGTITARFADPGALVQNAATSQASALPLVTVSEIKRLRVDVFVDQRDATFVQTDAPVEISVSERPGVKIMGTINRISDELDPRTKMMLTEIDIPNDDRSLVAGSFVQVSLRIHSPPYLEAPVESLILKDNKPQLTVVSSDNQLTYKPIVIADNDGKLLRILSGVQAGDVVALNVGDTIPEGGKVRPLTMMESIPAPKPSPSSGAK
ncbi:MAG: efflux RND transporter periplasmic adaptor subunit [Oligoflexia bacterium]|nr:efflux RND transporter periplasmic adaptor subunit [Oligoflexia bacterium]